MTIYEVHAPSWRKGLGWRELADQLAPYVRDLGFTHVELLPVMHHPYSGSWGYQVTGYYATLSTLGSPDDFRYFVDHMHANGIGVLLDWVPAHFPRDDWALARFDGTALYEHADPRRGAHPDWGTLVFNLGRTEVQNFLLANALFWLREYHADGLRVDAVASMLYLDYSRKAGEWVPNQFGGREDLDAVAFLKELNELMHAREPGVISAAEESTAWPGVSRPTYLGGLGFGLKWNMGWMHDTLGYFQHDPIHRRFHHHELTFSLVYAWNENFMLPLSHDEVVHGKGSLLSKMPGDRWQQLANLRALYAYMWAHPGKKLLFMGGELANPWEWTHEDELPWWLLEHADHAGVRDLMRDLNRVYLRRARALGGRLLARGLPLDRAERRAQQRARVRARVEGRDAPDRLHREPRRRCRARATASACRVDGAWSEVAEHRFVLLRRHGRREPRRGDGGGASVARPAVLGLADAAAAVGHLAAARRLSMETSTDAPRSGPGRRSRSARNGTATGTNFSLFSRERRARRALPLRRARARRSASSCTSARRSTGTATSPVSARASATATACTGRTTRRRAGASTRPKLLIDPYAKAIDGAGRLGRREHAARTSPAAARTPI